MVKPWCSASDRRRVQARPGPHMRVNIREAVQIFSLKGDQLSAQGFNPGLGNSRRCALNGRDNPARHIGSKSFACACSFSRGTPGSNQKAEDENDDEDEDDWGRKQEKPYSKNLLVTYSVLICYRVLMEPLF